MIAHTGAAAARPGRSGQFDRDWVEGAAFKVQLLAQLFVVVFRSEIPPQEVEERAIPESGKRVK